MRSVRTIQSNVINFQNYLTSFAIFQSFTDLFRELNVREIENHYKMNSEKVETWHGNIISPTWHVKKSREGYGKNWTHFMYKLENLFRSIRVSDENSSGTRALHFFKLIWTPDFFMFLCTIQSDVINFQHFLTSSAIFPVIYRLVYRGKWPWNSKSLQNDLWKGWNLAWYHHFTHSAWAKE